LVQCQGYFFINVWPKNIFDIYVTEYGTALTTILPILFLYLNTVIVTTGTVNSRSRPRHEVDQAVSIRVITKLPNSEQSYKGKVKTHNYANRQNQSTTGKLWKPQWPYRWVLQTNKAFNGHRDHLNKYRFMLIFDKFSIRWAYSKISYQL
jgi:hypothetical protein